MKIFIVDSGGPWENGLIEIFNGTLSDELLNGEIFEMMLEVYLLIERRRNTYHAICSQSAVGYLPPAPETRQPHKLTFATLQQPCAVGSGLMDSLTKKLVPSVGAGHEGNQTLES